MADRGRKIKPSFTSRITHILLYPIELFSSAIAFVLRPIAPQLIPFAVFSLLVPLLVIPAVVSGVYVWHGRAVSWQSPLFFQYGCVLTYDQVHFLMNSEATDLHRMLKHNLPHSTLHNLMTYPSTSLFQRHSLTMIWGTS